ncbi:MAG: uroporphyrinogen decarboxylase family protein [Chloroflexota bacterium]|nr:uroporphyrinogen decarboxylase family protein [Chloroflexota bacterium]
MNMGVITPRERVRLALQHQETDRVPVDFLATPETWSNLKAHLGLPNDESVLKYFGVDVRHPRWRYVGPPLPTYSDGSYQDAWGITWSPVSYDGGVYYEPAGHPLADIQDASALSNYRWPDPDWWDVSSMVEAIGAWDRDTEYAIFLEDFGDPGGFYEITNYMRGMEQVFYDMALNPDIPFEIMRRITDVFIVLAERVLAALGDRIDLIWTSDDIAHQRGMMMSLPMWRQLIFPHHERFNRRVHELGGRIMYHSCGSVVDALPGLIEMGIDVLDVLQFSADNMVPENLKSTYGDQLGFHGGADVQQLLPRASEREVRSTIRHIIDVMGRGGGFILSPSHAVQVDTPLANIIAIYQEAGSLMDSLPTSAGSVTARTTYGPVPPES